MHTIALAMGTRPEVIKFAPLVRELERSTRLHPLVIATGQHSVMAEQAFRVFDIQPKIDLQLMSEGQTPNSFLSRLLATLPATLSEQAPALLVVQGDTCSTLGSALAAFHLGIPVAHIEAGLRSGSLDSPFPEEMNRSAVSRCCKYHFAPTERAVSALREEAVPGTIHLVGNTVVDAVVSIAKALDEGTLQADETVQRLAQKSKRFVLVTGHRRENFDTPFQYFCEALLQLRDTFSDLEFIFPVHLNPQVQAPAKEQLAGQERIHLLEPLDYVSLVYLIKHCSLIISDSGGIQEEAPTFGKRVLVTRNTTERPEAIESGHATLCPLTSVEPLVSAASGILSSAETEIPNMKNPFGDGAAARKIVEILEAELG